MAVDNRKHKFLDNADSDITEEEESGKVANGNKIREIYRSISNIPISPEQKKVVKKN